MGEGSRTRFRLPVWGVLHDTFVIPGTHLREFLTPLAFPGVVVAVLILGWQLARSSMPALVGWTIYGVYAAIFTVLAVTCHRLVLLGPSPATLVPKLQWGARETRFFGWMVLLVLIFAVGRLVLMLVIANLGLQIFFYGLTTRVEGVAKHGMGWLQWPDYLAFVICVYIVARISLVLPATAIDRKVSLQWAWRETAHNGWRLAVIVGAFPWLLSYGVGMLRRENATLPELVLIVVLSVLTLMLEITALSLAYSELASMRETSAKEN